jgi:hypothetical protein
MRTQTEIGHLKNLLICALLAFLACLIGLVPVGGPRADQDKTSESWWRVKLSKLMNWLANGRKQEL